MFQSATAIRVNDYHDGSFRLPTTCRQGSNNWSVDCSSDLHEYRANPRHGSSDSGTARGRHALRNRASYRLERGRAQTGRARVRLRGELGSGTRRVATFLANPSQSLGFLLIQFLGDYCSSEERWCGRVDSNHHGIATASPSSWCVCQFRHDRSE